MEGQAGDAAVVRAQQVDRERVLHHLDLGRPRDRRDEGALDLRAGRVATRVGDAVAVVAALAGQAELAVGVEVEVGTQGDQLADRIGTLGHQDPYGVQVTGPRTGDEGVALVLRRGVARAERGRDAALRPLGRPGVEHVLGHHEHLVDPATQAQRGSQARDPGPDHHHVGAHRPAGIGCLQAADHASYGHAGRLAARLPGPAPAMTRDDPR